jgi:tetratricopeptide (TPR) repeat protein
MLMPLIFIFFLIEKKTKIKITYFLLLSVIYLNLIILQSRSIWITIVAVGLLGMTFLFQLKLIKLFFQNKKWLILLITVFILISIFYSTENIINRSPSFLEQRILPAFEGKDPSLNQRLLILNTAYKMFENRPLFGLGIGIFKMQYLFYQAEVLEDLPWYLPYYTKAQEAHNEYLQLLVELGILGLVSFLIMFYLFYKKILLALFHENASNQVKAILLGLLMGISAFLIHCLFTFPLHVPALGMTFFGMLGLTVAYIGTINIKKRDKLKENTTNSKNNGILHKRKSLQLSVIILSIAAFYLINFLVFRPYYAEFIYFQGLRYTVDQDYASALLKFEKANQHNPYDGKNLHALGGTYYNLKNYKKAEALLVKAKHYLTDINTFYNLGLIYSQIGLYKKAEEEYKQAVYLDPKFTKGYHYLGLLYFQKGDFDKAIEQWNEILKIEANLSNKYIVLNNLGIVYQKKEMPDKALEYFVQALQLVPEGDPIEKEIEEEINKIYKSKLSN